MSVRRAGCTFLLALTLVKLPPRGYHFLWHTASLLSSGSYARAFALFKLFLGFRKLKCAVQKQAIREREREKKVGVNGEEKKVKVEDLFF